MQRILHRISQSIKYRACYRYCLTLQALKSRLLPLGSWEPIDETLPRLVSIVREGDIPFLIRNLHSLRRHHDALPRLTVIGDSDGAFSVLKNLFPPNSETVSIRHWQEDLPSLRPEEQKFISSFASGSMYGFAKKFVVLLAASRREKILFSDGDILWFGPLLSRRKDLFSGSTLVMGTDFTHSLDMELADYLGEPRMLTGPPVNSGFVYYPQGILEGLFSPRDYAWLMNHVPRATCHFEQTLIAFVFCKTGGQLFTPEEVLLTWDDNFHYRRRIRALVRHYAGCKQLFWRDV